MGAHSVIRSQMGLGAKLYFYWIQLHRYFISEAGSMGDEESFHLGTHHLSHQ